MGLSESQGVLEVYHQKAGELRVETIKVLPMSFHWTLCYVYYYVSDLIFWSHNVTHIDKVAMELCKLGVALEQEDDAAGFLGVKME